MKPPTLKLCLVDMNNGVKNEATRCFRRLFDALVARAKAVNPGLEFHFTHVQPRNLGERPDRDADLVLSSGGPGSPFDGYDDHWCIDYRKFLDSVVERNVADPANAPGLLVVCHSFELSVTHFEVATMVKRDRLRFGVMPAYVTEAGQHSALLAPFGDRLFTWEHRSWEAVDLNEARLRELGGEVLARESRPGRNDKGRALLSFRFAPGISGTQFHPEADRAGVLAWINRPEHAAALRDAYGSSLYQRMMKTLADPNRLARTFALFVPGWLTHEFNRLAKARGLVGLPPPEQSMLEFGEPVSAAV